MFKFACCVEKKYITGVEYHCRYPYESEQDALYRADIIIYIFHNCGCRTVLECDGYEIGNDYCNTINKQTDT